LALIGLLIVLLVFVPVAADAHRGFEGGLILGLGTGLIDGFVFAPRLIYVAPQVARSRTFGPPVIRGRSFSSVQPRVFTSPSFSQARGHR